MNKIVAWVIYLVFISVADCICKYAASTNTDLGLLLSFIEGCLAVVYVRGILLDGGF